MTHRTCSDVYQRCIARLTLILMAACVPTLTVSSAWAQATGSVNGTVHDSAGAVVTEAKVILHNRDTNLERSAVTNDVGAYVMPDVQPGNYDLKVLKNGFGQALKS